MAETHQLILDKLKNYPEEVQALAQKALEFAETMPEATIAEQLKGVIRQITKSKGGKE